MKLSTQVVGDDAVRAVFARIGEAGPKALAATAEDSEAYVEGEAAHHNRTGKMVASITKTREPDGWLIAHDLRVAPYTVFVHWGARPHKIKPKNKRVLRWPGPGGFNFAKGVDHPGYKGDAWMTRAAALAPRMFAFHIDAQLKG